MVSPRHRESLTGSFELGNGVAQGMGRIKVLSWNVEGLTELKEMEIVHYMFRFDIDICGMQEPESPGPMSTRPMVLLSSFQEALNKARSGLAWDS